jgi:transaldolase
MKIFVDTAEVHEIQELHALGIIDGVTTNPSLIAKSGRHLREVLTEICALVDGPVSGETVSTDAEGMIREGRWLREIAENLTVKVPLTPAGIQATKTLSDEGTPVNVTLCFSANQALLAAKAGAAFISPFVGRLDDIGQEGMQLIQDIRVIYDNYGFTTEILTASARHPQHFLEAARIGSDVITVPPKVIWQLFQHPLTDKGLAAFLADWEKTGQSLG